MPSSDLKFEGLAQNPAAPDIISIARRPADSWTVELIPWGGSNEQPFSGSDDSRGQDAGLYAPSLEMIRLLLVLVGITQARVPIGDYPVRSIE